MGTMGRGLVGPTTALEEFATLLPWLRLHLTKHGNVPYTKERDVLTGARVVVGCSRPKLVGKLKPRTMGATT